MSDDAADADDLGTDEATAVEAFKDLGLTGYEAKAFLALQRLGSGTARDVARVADVPRSQVYSVADSLEAHGLVEVQQSNPRRFRPVSIDRARRTLRERFESRQERAFEYAERLREVSAPGEEQEEDVWTIRGRSHVTDRALEHVAEASERLDFATRVPDLVEDELRDAICDRATAGVDVTVISENEAVREQFADCPSVAVTEPPRPHGDDERSGRIVIADDDRLLLSVIDDDGGETAIWSAESLFARVFIQLVEASGVLHD